MRATTLLVSGLLAIVAFGCADPGSVASPSAPATDVPAADYVTQVNTLCVKLVEDVLEVAGAHPGSYPIAEYEAERPKMNALIAEFDAKVAAVPVAAGERPAAAAFDAFRRLSDETDADLAAAAATGDQAVFDAAIEKRHDTFDASSVLPDLAAAGIACNGR